MYYIADEFKMIWSKSCLINMCSIPARVVNREVTDGRGLVSTGEMNKAYEV